MSFKLLPCASEKTCRGHGTQQSVYFGAFSDSLAVSVAHFNNPLWTELHHKCFRLKCFSQPAAPINPLPFMQRREEGSERHRLPPFPGRLIHFLGLKCNCSDVNQGTNCFSETAALHVRRRTAAKWKQLRVEGARPKSPAHRHQTVWKLGSITRDVVKVLTAHQSIKIYKIKVIIDLLARFSWTMDVVESTFKESLDSVKERKWSLWFKKNLTWAHKPAARADHRWPVFVRSLVFSSCSASCGWMNYEKRHKD